MERVSTTIRVGQSVTTERGMVISVSKISKLRVTPEDTARHEAAHIVAAQSSAGIILATIVGSSEYLGATWPVAMDAITAMAAHALGHDGTGHDRMLTKYLLGVDPDSAASSALATLAGQHDFIYAVASRLQEKGTITQGDVDEVRKELDQEKLGVWDVAIHMRAENGTTNIYMRRSRNGEVELPGDVSEQKQNSLKKNKNDTSEDAKKTDETPLRRSARREQAEDWQQQLEDLPLL